jgi:hypothetical protein
MAVQVVPADNPYHVYCELATGREADAQDQLLLAPFSCQQSGDVKLLDQDDLIAIYLFSGTSVYFSVVTDDGTVADHWQTFSRGTGSRGTGSRGSGSTDSLSTNLGPALTEWLTQKKAPLFTLQQPLPLQPIGIPKPWGQEIWYTGVEARGVARFGTDDRQIPIPHLLAVMPSLLGQVPLGPLILLKILDPLPEEIFGDLYFELHNEKREVYVVTHIDRQAWPNGVGRMRLGFNAEAIERAGSQDAFRRQFLEQVVAYREVRFEIDRLLDASRQEHNLSLNEPLPVEQLKGWLQEIPQSLVDREKQLRQAMESYYGSLPLQAGDVVQVPLNVPHSLQHGVRTIEFQTPVYERRIVAFGQKVLTQSAWDTERAVEEMDVTTPRRPQLPVVTSRDGLMVERVVDFSDFQVERFTLSEASSYETYGDTYRLMIVIQGQVIVGNHELAAEGAVLLPALANISIRPQSEDSVVFLIATPLEGDDHC